MGVKDYDLNPDNNTQINGINIAEGCPPSGINNAIRQLMADVKADSDAQNTKAETPASAESLGPVKVGDGLTIGEDGTLSADLATAENPGRVKASETAQAGATPLGMIDGGLDFSWSLGKIWIGVPRFWRSTNLPPNHCWANGDFIPFADWPELEAVYDAGGFEGMLLPWDASSKQQAANLGKWRPDAANPTGLYAPQMMGKFLRSWVPSRENGAGETNKAGVPNLNGKLSRFFSPIFEEKTGVFAASYAPINGNLSTTSHLNHSFNGTIVFDASDANAVYGASKTVMPESVNFPLIIYLGNPA